MSRALISRRGIGIGMAPVLGAGGGLELRDILNVVYPVGSVLLLANDQRPEIALNFAGSVWDRIPHNYVIASTLGEEGTFTEGDNAATGSTTLAKADIPEHSHTISGYSQEVGSHTHTGPSHNHALSDHTNTVPAHSHLMAHTHTIPSHTHTMPSHSHGIGKHIHRYNYKTGVEEHSHDIPGHSHTTPAHVHEIENHTHKLEAITHEFVDHKHEIGNHVHDIRGALKLHIHDFQNVDHAHFLPVHSHEIEMAGAGSMNIHGILGYSSNPNNSQAMHVTDRSGVFAVNSVDPSHPDDPNLTNVRKNSSTAGPGSSHSQNTLFFRIGSHTHNTKGDATYYPNLDSTGQTLGQSNFHFLPSGTTGIGKLDPDEILETAVASESFHTGSVVGDYEGSVEFEAETNEGGAGRTVGDYKDGQKTDGSGTTGTVTGLSTDSGGVGITEHTGQTGTGFVRVVNDEDEYEDEPARTEDSEIAPDEVDGLATVDMPADSRTGSYPDEGSISTGSSGSGNTGDSGTGNTGGAGGFTVTFAAKNTGSYGAAANVGHSHMINLNRIKVNVWQRTY